MLVQYGVDTPLRLKQKQQGYVKANEAWESCLGNKAERVAARHDGGLVDVVGAGREYRHQSVARFVVGCQPPRLQRPHHPGTGSMLRVSVL